MKIDNLPTVSTIRHRSGTDVKITESSSADLDKALLTQGRLLKGKILSIAQNGRITLEIEGKTLSATSRVPLEKGSEVWLEVSQTGKEPQLILASKKGAVVDLLRAMADNQAIDRAVKILLGFFPASAEQLPPDVADKFTQLLRFFMKNAVADDADVVKIIKTSAWVTSGQKFQGKILVSFDPTQQLNDLLANMGIAGPGFHDKNDSVALEKLINLLESLGQFNSQPEAQKKVLTFLFPCFFASGDGWGVWMFDSQKQQKDDEAAGKDYFVLTFFLSMSRLGDMNCNIRVRDKSLQGEFFLEQQDAVDHMKKHLDELSTLLGSLGFSPVNFTCTARRANALQEVRDTLIEKVRMDSFALIDLTA